MAAHLGMTVRQMASAMTMREFAMWRIKYNSDPWGERRMDLRFARGMALYANAHLSQGTPPFEADAFMPKFGEPDEDAEDDEVTEEPRDILAPETKAWLLAMAARNKNGN